MEIRMVGVILAGCVLAGVAGSGPAAPDAGAGKSPTAAVVTSKHPSETLSPLLQEALPNVKGKTFTAAVVDFPPNARAVPHRHGQAFVYAYVLAGAVRSKLDGQPVHTYHQGENWVEQPGAHPVLTENTSRTKPAKLLVDFVSNTGDALKIPDPKK
ncbi:cupin domain-containing protein [Streptomyces mirabilis]|uniref:cupin domain-containing protein n=1 Tax=Streptomyces mirabilis TaxID=68239 RepID=UPI00331BD22D